MGVTSTRQPSKAGKGWLVNRAKKALGWYTQDFIVRTRVCVGCKSSILTAEISIEDVKGIIQESVKGHAPDILLSEKR